jgi:hypothetical protein
MLFALAALLGGAFSLGLLNMLGRWVGPALASFACASIVGLAAGYVWYRLSLLMRRRPPAREPEAGLAQAASRIGVSSTNDAAASVRQPASDLGKDGA